MKIDTNAPYKVPKEYEAKKNAEPKMKGSSVFIVILGTILIYVAMAAAIVAVVWGAIFGITKLSESINDANSGNSNPDITVNEA